MIKKRELCQDKTLYNVVEHAVLCWDTLSAILHIAVAVCFLFLTRTVVGKHENGKQ